MFTEVYHRKPIADINLRKRKNKTTVLIFCGYRQSKIVYLRIACPSENWSQKRCSVWHLQSLPRFLNLFIIISLANVRLSVLCSSIQSLCLHKNLQNICTSFPNSYHRHDTWTAILSVQKRLNLKKRRSRRPWARFYSKSKVAEPADCEISWSTKEKRYWERILEALLWNATN